MILVTVGNHYQNFNRLIIVMDNIASDSDEEIVIQRGYCDYFPRFATHFQWTSYAHMEELTKSARIVVGHAGSGTIITTLIYMKPLIIVPRLKEFEEHVDDHQLQLTKIMEAKGNAICVRDLTVENMKSAFNEAALLKPRINKPTSLIYALQQQITSWDLYKSYQDIK